MNASTLTVAEINIFIGTFSAIGVCFIGMFALWYRFITMEKRTFHRQEDMAIVFDALRGCLEGLKEHGCNGEVTKALNKLNEYTSAKAAGLGGDGKLRK